MRERAIMPKRANRLRASTPIPNPISATAMPNNSVNANKSLTGRIERISGIKHAANGALTMTATGRMPAMIPMMPTTVWVSNSSSSGSDWELDEVPTAGDPPDLVQIRSGSRVLTGARQRRVASNDA